MTGWIQAIAELSEVRRDFVLVTLAGMRGSAPQEVGAKMLVTNEGLHWGTVGGGKIEAHCIRHAQKLLLEGGASHLEKWNLQTDIGMSCGGEVSLFFDGHLFDNWTIALFGAGHVSQELCRVMQTWTAQVRVFDTRPEWIEKLPCSKNIQAKLSTDLGQEVASLPKGSILISMTQGHSADLPVLEAALRRHEHFSFLGVIGSRLKGEKIKKELMSRGISDLALERLVCPVGLEFGNNTPPEISISIAAQILSLRTEEKK